MKIIDNSKRTQLFFMEIDLGKTFRQGDERVYVKIAEVCVVDELVNYVDNYSPINCEEDIEDAGVCNAYCLDGNYFTFFDDGVFVELVDCEIHIV